MMPPTGSPAESKSKWFWIIILLALLFVVLVWFADPLDKVEGTPQPEPTANPTEWTLEPTEPAVEVNLPQTPMKNSPTEGAAKPSE
jgi:hypothetical protein